MALSETIIDAKFIPIGDKPNNKPVSPVNPKLKATDRTASSGKSNLFSLRNKRFTKQYPGTAATYVKPKMYLTMTNGDSLGIVNAKSVAKTVTRRIISNHRVALTLALQDFLVETKNKRVEV
jgi:hypothetical protein